MTERGHEVHVICQAVGEAGNSIDGGVIVHRVGTNPKRYSVIGRLNYSLSAWRKLKAVIRQYDIEIVEAAYWGAEGFLCSFSRHTPLVIRLATSASEILKTKTYSGKKEWGSLKVLSLLEDISARRADRVIVTTEALYNTLTEGLHFDAGKVDIVRHAIDTDKYNCVVSGIREKYGVPPGTPLVMFVGRLEARKGVHVLCRAIPAVIGSIPSIRFVMVGRDTNTAPDSGSMKAFMTEYAGKSGFEGNLIFIDRLSQNELIEMYSACDLLVSPSIHESFGLVTLEAMACGKPVVATSTGLAPELKLAGAGMIVVAPGSADELADAIVKSLSFDSEEREAVARVNRQLVECEFSLPQWVDRVVDVYERAVQGGARRRGGSR